MDKLNSGNVATATATEALPLRHACQYTGAEALEGFEDAALPLLGEYWEQSGLFLFQPNGSGKIFEVSDLDIKRISVN